MVASAITPHVRIDNSIVDNLAAQIGIYGLGIYVAIKRHLNQKTGDCFPSYQTIAKKLHIDRGTVIRYVKKLKAFNVLDPQLRFKEDGSPTSNQYNFDKGSGTEQPDVVVEDNQGGGTKQPKQSEPNKKQRTITDVDFYAHKNQSTLSCSHSQSVTPTDKQKTCPHPPSEIALLSENIIICNHCFSLLDENLSLAGKPVATMFPKSALPECEPRLTREPEAMQPPVGKVPAKTGSQKPLKLARKSHQISLGEGKAGRLTNSLALIGKLITGTLRSA